MLIKFGVDISRLKRPMRRGLNKIESAFRFTGDEPVITSTYEGTHSPGSLHYADLAVDFRLPAMPGSDLVDLLSRLKEALGQHYDVVLETNHFHVEYDPK